MTESNTTYRVGDAEITRISEIALDGVDIDILYPGSDPSTMTASANRLGRLQNVAHRRWVEIGAGVHRVLLEIQRWQAYDAIIDFLTENGLNGHGDRAA